MTRQATAAVALRWIAATTLLIGAGIHAIAVAPHADHWIAAGAFFAGLATAQAAAAWLLVTSRSTVGPAGAATVSGGAVVLWLVTRTAGLPFGPGAGEPESVTIGDLLSTASSLATLVALVPLLRLPVPRSFRLTGAPAGALAVAAPLTLVATLIVATPSVKAHQHDHGGGHAPTTSVATPGSGTPAADAPWPPVTSVATAAPSAHAAQVQALVEAAYAKGQAATEEP